MQKEKKYFLQLQNTKFAFKITKSALNKNYKSIVNCLSEAVLCRLLMFPNYSLHEYTIHYCVP